MTMAPESSALTKRASLDVAQQIDPSQTLRAATALLRKIQSDQETRTATAEKPNLLAGEDEDEAGDDTPVWLVLSTKKHIIDKKRLKPGKILLPHPYLDTASPDLRICLITTDPQRKVKDLIAHPTFPLDLAKRIGRIIGMAKLKAKYKSFESRRQLLSEYDVFLADDRIITYLPQILGKVFYQKGNKRPVPVSLEGKRQNHDEQGNKRRKLSEGGTKVVKTEVTPATVAHEIERTLSSALVHLAPSTTTAVKVGTAKMEPQQLQENVQAVTEALVDRYVPQKWRNVRAIHMKGPNTAALPVWLAEELWEDEKDVLDQPLPLKETKKSKKRKLGALAEGEEVIQVPGPDGKMRRVEKSMKVKGVGGGSDALAKAVSKSQPKAGVDRVAEVKTKVVQKNGDKAVRKVRAKAADLI